MSHESEKTLALIRLEQQYADLLRRHERALEREGFMAQRCMAAEKGWRNALEVLEQIRRLVREENR
jgi:hypothetical protein